MLEFILDFVRAVVPVLCCMVLANGAVAVARIVRK